MEDMQDFIDKERKKKAEENLQKIMDKFKDEVEKEGGTIYFAYHFGETLPTLHISAGISDALKEKISVYKSQFYNLDDL